MFKLTVVLLVSFNSYIPVHTCPLLIAPHSGSILGHCSNSSTNETCEHTCEAGYVLKGERILTCLSTGQWDFIVPSCQRITCKNVVALDHVTIGGDCLPGLANRICSFRCHQDYEPVDQSAIVCQEDGTWDKQPPKCQKVNPVVRCKTMHCRGGEGIFLGQCNPGIPTQTFRLLCASGYSLVGGGTMKCRQNGQWEFRFTTVAPTCKKDD